MNFFEQLRYYFNYVLPDLIYTFFEETNILFSNYWWIFAIITIIVTFILIKTFRKYILIKIEQLKFNNFFSDLAKFEEKFTKVETKILESKILLKAEYGAIYEIRGETYLLIAKDVNCDLFPFRIGKRELNSLNHLGKYTVNTFFNSNKSIMIVFLSYDKIEKEKYQGFFNLLLSYLKLNKLLNEIHSSSNISLFAKETITSLLKLNIDYNQFFKFITFAILQATGAKGLRLLTKDDKIEFEKFENKNSKLQKVFYIRNTPYKLEYYNDLPLDQEKIVQIGSFLDLAGTNLINLDKNSVMIKNYLDLIEFLNNAIEMKSKYFKNHSLKVQTVSVEIAKSMFLSQNQIDNISLGAKFHDIGMVSDILNSIDKKKLNSQELDLIKKHPIIGSVLVEPIAHIYPIVEIIKFHHERYDGKGYPYGIKEDNIPIEANIVALAEHYIGLISDRAYKSGLPHKEAIKEIKNLSKKAFFPTVVEAFLDSEKTINTKIEKIEKRNQNAT